MHGAGMAMPVALCYAQEMYVARVTIGQRACTAGAVVSLRASSIRTAASKQPYSWTNQIRLSVLHSRTITCRVSHPT